MCRYFLNISSTFEQYRDNTDNRDNFGHYNRDKKFSYRYIPIPNTRESCSCAATLPPCAKAFHTGRGKRRNRGDARAAVPGRTLPQKLK